VLGDLLSTAVQYASTPPVMKDLPCVGAML
jgi:hypothetical protein